MSTGLQLFLTVLCLLGTGLFAGLETGIISINRLRLQHLVRRGVRGAAVLQSFLEQPDHLLGTTLVGTNICMVTASVSATSLATRLFGPWAAGIASILMALFILVACEYLPKAWFQSRPWSRTRPFATFLRCAGYLLYPASKLIMLLARLLVPAPSIDQQNSPVLVTKEELKQLTHEGEQSGELTSDERRMIHAVLELAHTRCRDMMVPRQKIIVVHEDTPRAELLHAARSKGLVRLPVFHDQAKRFVGVVHVFDVFRDAHPKGKTARDYMRPPQFVTGDTPADELLPRMRLTRQPMALVVDKRSEVIGLVTSDMVLQEIVAEL